MQINLLISLVVMVRPMETINTKPNLRNINMAKPVITIELMSSIS